MGFTVYKSSAGSGKTYTLVKEYLKLILREKSDNRYRNILAITFTNKAAAEMKERVITALTELSANKLPTGTSYFLLQDLKKDMSLDETTIRLKCAAVLTSMLHNYSDIAIGTIDKFVHKIVRSFAYDLQLPVNFSVELESENLLQTAIDTLISRVGGDEQLTKALVAFTERKADQEKSWNVEMDLMGFAQDLLKEHNQDYLNLIKDLSLSDFFNLQKKLQSLTAEFENQLQHIGKQALDVLFSNDVEHKDLAGGEVKGLAKYFGYLRDKRNDKYEPSATHVSNVEKENWFSSKSSAQAKNNISNCKDELKQLFFKAQKLVQKQLKNYILYSAIERNIYGLSLLNEIEKIIVEIKKENNLVHISEFSKRIAAVVMHEPVPFIYERLGEKYQNYLIDEFQDTSVMQWQNFLPLIENALATDEFNMVVGDGKQAIYRWRGGDVEQFVRLPKLLNSAESALLKEREAALSRNFIEEKLEFNHRSKREIIEFNNSFFRFVVNRETFPSTLKPIYEDLAQKFNPENSGGFVNFNLFKADTTGADLKDRMNKQVLLTIRNLQAANYQLKDIAILTRNNKNGVELSKFLIEAGVEVVSKESLLLSTSAHVNFIVNVLGLLNDSDDAIAKAGMMNYILKLIGFNKLDDLNNYFESDVNFHQFIQTHFPSWSHFELLHLPLYELCEEVVRIFGLNIPADAYVTFFLDAVHQYTSKFNNSLSDFMDWWERKKKSLSIIIPHGLNAVNVLTVHKSKGLEYPIVIFPFATWGSKRSGENIWVKLADDELPGLKAALLPLSSSLEKSDFAELYTNERNKQIVDDLNILYVAFTRAVDGMYVISSQPENNQEPANYYKDYLKDLGIWQDEKEEYIFGSVLKTQEPKQGKETVGVFTLEKMISSEWRSKISLSNQSERLWLNETQNVDIKYGNLMHTALSRIRIAEDIADALQSMLVEGLINDAEKEQLRIKLHRILSLKSVEPYFSGNVNIKTEAEILLKGGKSYRPDRIVFYPEKTVVLDYKTGVETERHKEQILNYAAILQQMGYPHLETYLLYTETEKLVNV